LGDDAFTQHHITDIKIKNLTKIMRAFKLLMSAYEPINYLACATSALRESDNGSEIAECIRSETGVDLKVIDGREEAEILFLNSLYQNIVYSVPYLYIDVGGGSTELTFFLGLNDKKSGSFQIGTVRLLENKVRDSEWKEMRRWIKESTSGYDSIVAIGSGGNINKIFRLSLNKEGKPLSFKKLKNILKYLNEFSFEDRIRLLNLRPDRADVIVPAAEIYLFVMKAAGINKIYVPQVGLADGLIHLLYDQYRKEKN
jgi:exopolyphosphatase/guanosine-5'-triphosphate,3'-diphosphate pyrophosphatase